MDGIYGNRFYSLREPAWHGLGHVSQTEIGAVEALNVAGDYNIDVVALAAPAYPDLTITQRAIVRLPNATDSKPYLLSIVGPEYTAVAPRVAAELWDKTVVHPVETLGVLREGADMFITTKLPAFDVRGDPCDSYMLLRSPLKQGVSAQACATGVRVVCANTLATGLAGATERLRVPHNADVLDKLSAWLPGLYDTMVFKSEALQQAFEIFAETSPKEKELASLIEQILPEPPMPEQNAPRDVMATRAQAWVEKCLANSRRRDLVRKLFDGGATGYDSPAMKGTLWGLYNSVTEFADWVGVSVADDDEDGSNSTEFSAVFGKRNALKVSAYNVIASYVGVA